MKIECDSGHAIAVLSLPNLDLRLLRAEFVKALPKLWAKFAPSRLRGRSHLDYPTHMFRTSCEADFRGVLLNAFCACQLL